ncbi:coiled-coil domain-containing protein 40-like [Takifugu flavidus]|uniref:coiled-coil domain-containing protein 40-like n=1 Tax=Takifugu flavidus TaxID=433684 RepID=UPI002544171E|nr:coiled-coil domain-containing protein 40-like [Takifugu flavidus]
MKEDEQELIFLDTDHPMVLRYQEGMKKQLRHYLEKLELQIEEKRAIKKDRERHSQELQVDVLKNLKDLSSKKAQLEELTVIAEKAREEHLKVQDKLVKIKTEYDSMKHKKNKLENDVNQKLAELDDLNVKLHYTQKYSEALHGDVKAKKNINQKTRTQRKRAEEQKFQQDLCVEHLTKELERVIEEIKMYEVQITAQLEKKERAKNTSSEAEMLLEDMLLQHKWIRQQWINSLQMMEKTVEKRNAMQEAVSGAMQEVNLLDGEIQRNRKSNNEMQEKNEKLTMELQMAQIQCEAIKRTINKKKDEEEVLLAQYSSYQGSIKQAENTLLHLKKEASAAQSVLNNHRKQLEKESALRLDLEGKIRTQMQQMIIHNRTAKNYQQLFGKLTDTKNEKMCQLLQLENEIAAVENKKIKVARDVDALNITLEDQEKEIAEKTKHNTSCESKICSRNKEIEQNQRTIQNMKNKMAEIAARTGNEDLSPYETKILNLKEQRRELEETMKNHTQLWLTKQETRVRLTLEYEATSKATHKLQIEYTTLQKKKMRLDGLMDIENRELKQLQNKAKALTRSLQKLNIQIDDNGKQRMLLEEKKMMMEMDFLGRIKEAEQAAASIQMKYNRTEEEKENLCNCLMESEWQKLLWERKIQLAKETRSEIKKQNEELQKLKMVVRKKETQLNQQVKEGEKLMKESEALAERWGNIAERRLVLWHTSDKIKHNRKCEMERTHEAQKRNLTKMKKQLSALDESLKELKQKKTLIVEDIEKKKQEVTEHHLKNEAFDSEITKLQDDKERSLVLTEALQNWAKHLKMLRDGTSKPPTNTEAVTAAFSKEVENLHSLYEKVQHICRECPENQEELRRLRIALEAHMTFLTTAQHARHGSC